MTTKLNQKAKGANSNIQKVAAKRGQELAVSANGNLQFKKEPLLELYELAVSTFFGKGTFYSTSDQLVQRLRKNVDIAVKMGALDFVANLAIHARGEMNMRTIPIVLVVEFAKSLRDNNVQYSNLRKVVRDVIQRADQITDTYAYSLQLFGDKKNIPMAIKRGVADSFNKFDEYKFAKYNRSNEVKLRDVLRIVHPVAKDVEQGQLFEKIMKDTLAVPNTWEVKLSTNGQKPVSERKSDKDLWTEMVNSGDLGYMALLKNLRNMVEAKIDSDTRQSVCAVLRDPAQVARSRQMPFDIIQAYDVVKPLDGTLASAVSKALDLSVSNMPSLGKKIWIIVDFSGSMDSSRGSATSPYETATLLAAALIKANAENAFDLAVTVFGSEAKTVRDIDSNQSVLGIKQQLQAHRTGRIAGSTNFGAAIAQYDSLGFVPDAIVVCSDGEVNGFPYRQMVKVNQSKALKLTIDFSASPSTPTTPHDGWFALAGWTTAMFKWLDAIREKNTVVDALSVPYIGTQRKQKSSEINLDK